MEKFFIVLLDSELLTSFGKISRDALTSKETTKIVEKLSVDSRCNRFYEKRNYKLKKANIDTVGCFVANR
jgi:hypothetical protein